MTVNIEAAIQRRRHEMQADIFINPPADWQGFVKRQAIWSGLGEAINIINEEKKTEEFDD